MKRVTVTLAVNGVRTVGTGRTSDTRRAALRLPLPPVIASLAATVLDTSTAISFSSSPDAAWTHLLALEAG